MISFSEKHRPKHAKVQGKFSLAWTSATPLTILQIQKLILAETQTAETHTCCNFKEPLCSQDNTWGEKYSQLTSSVTAKYITVLFARTKQYRDGRKIVLFMQSRNLRIWYHSNADRKLDFYTFSTKMSQTLSLEASHDSPTHTCKKSFRCRPGKLHSKSFVTRMGREEKWFEKLEGQAQFFDKLELSSKTFIYW